MRAGEYVGLESLFDSGDSRGVIRLLSDFSDILYMYHLSTPINNKESSSKNPEIWQLNPILFAECSVLMVTERYHSLNPLGGAPALQRER
jgi:hypothetical protein